MNNLGNAKSNGAQLAPHGLLTGCLGDFVEEAIITGDQNTSLHFHYARQSPRKIKAGTEQPARVAPASPFQPLVNFFDPADHLLTSRAIGFVL